MRKQEKSGKKTSFSNFKTNKIYKSENINSLFRFMIICLFKIIFYFPLFFHFLSYNIHTIIEFIFYEINFPEANFPKETPIEIKYIYFSSLKKLSHKSCEGTNKFASGGSSSSRRLKKQWKKLI